MAIADGAAGPVGVVERRVLVAAPDLAVEVADELVRLAVANRARTEQFQGAEVDRWLVDGRWRRGPAKTLRQDEAGEIDVLRRAFAAQVALTVGRGERIAPDHPLQSQFEQLIVRGLASLLQRLAVDVRGDAAGTHQQPDQGKLLAFLQAHLPLADAEDPAVARPAAVAFHRQDAGEVTMEVEGIAMEPDRFFQLEIGHDGSPVPGPDAAGPAGGGYDWVSLPPRLARVSLYLAMLWSILSMAKLADSASIAPAAAATAAAAPISRSVARAPSASSAAWASLFSAMFWVICRSRIAWLARAILLTPSK